MPFRTDLLPNLRFLKTIRFAYSAALLLLVGLQLGAFFLVNKQLVIRENEAELVTTIGSQRSWSQRIILIAERLPSDSHPEALALTRSQLNEAIEKMRSNHQKIYRYIELDDKGVLPETVRTLYMDPPVRLRERLFEFLTEAERVAALNEPRALALALADDAPLRNMGQDLLEHYQQVVEHLVEASENRVKGTENLTALVTGMTVLLAIGLVLFIFRPMERRIARDRDNLLKLNTELERLADTRAQALQQSEARAQSVLNTVVDGIVTIDRQGIVQSFNPAAERIFGYRQAEVTGKNVSILMPEPYHSAHDTYLQNYLETGHKKIIGIGREVTGQRKDGETFPLELAVSEMELGRERLFTGIVRDISARKHAETELKSVLAMRQAILDGANVSIIATNTEGIIQVFNKGAQRMLGYTAEEVVGKVTPAIIHVGEEVVARAKVLSEELSKPIAPGFEVFVAKTRSGRPDENEWTYVRKDGSTFPVLLSVTALFDADGNVLGYLGIGYDLTERKRIDQMKREFISTVSHELRTPLTSIRGALGLVAGGATGDLPEKAKELVTIATNNCDRLVRLINDILDVEKIESGKMVFNMQPLDLSDLVRETVAALQTFADQHRARIAIDGELPGMRIVGDRDRLAQVLTNLLSNAAKFSPPGGVVQVTLAQTDQQACLRIRDEGPGIPEDFQSRIFEKFSQADSSDTRSKSGTGLGLSISKAIVERHGGEIGFDSHPGQGTTFYVNLPMHPSQQAVTRQSGQISILVVEDDPDVAKLLRLLLDQAGYAVDNAYDISQARALLASRQYAAITLDLLLPGESGLSFVRELRENPETVNVPVIVVSAVAERGRKELNGSAVSVLDWLEKPIDEKRLLSAVDQAVQQSTAQKILHVEDDPDIALILRAMLEGVAEVDVATSLQDAQALLDHNRYALVILDVGLPDGSGLGLLPRLSRAKPPIPVVVFSAVELDDEIRKQVSAAFVKSRTDVNNLVQSIGAIVPLQVKGKQWPPP